MWPLLGWRRNGQATLRICQKHLLWREHMVSQCDAVFHYQTARKIDKAREIAHQTSLRSIVQMELKSLWVMRCFWNGEKTVGAACAELPPLLACHFNPTPTVIKFTAETNTASHPESITHTVNSCSYYIARHRQHLLRITVAVNFVPLPQECSWLVRLFEWVCVRLGNEIVIGILSGVIE